MIQINGKTYKNATLDVNAFCDFEEMGLELDQTQKRPFSLARAYLALCMQSSASEAGKQLNQHMVSGGSLEDIIKAFSEEAEKSDFFRSFKEKQEKENPEGEAQEDS